MDTADDDDSDGGVVVIADDGGDNNDDGEENGIDDGDGGGLTLTEADEDVSIGSSLAEEIMSPTPPYFPETDSLMALAS